MKIYRLLLPFFLPLACCTKSLLSLPSFQELPSPTSADLSCIAFSDSLHGSITGGMAWKHGFVMNTADGGISWQTDTVFDWKMEHVCFDAKGQGYACGQNILLYLPPGEAHWRLFRMDYQWLRACHFPDGKRGAMVGGEGFHGGLVHTFGPEPFWETDTVQTFPNELESVWYSDSTTIHAVGFGWVMRSGDGGQSWKRQDITGDFFQSVHFPTPATGYVCGSSGTILKSTDGGAFWQNIRNGGSTGKRLKPFRAICFASADKGWIVGDGGLFWQTEDGGNSWNSIIEAPGDADFTHIFLLGNKGWITAKDGRLFTFLF
ncbi:MAG: WD40/YVTN/BNR-like repeat-containing protein [Saprospiraceae bacterium]